MGEVHKIEMNDKFGFGDIQLPKRMILNPNKDVVLKIIDRIYKCEGKCPCQPNDPNRDTRCPCFDFIENQNCHCRLFVEGE